jgi:glutaminyl-tRNA synthetase
LAWYNKYGGKANLRFDDTNPTTEETEYVESIKADVQWLGFTWANELYTSNYFEQIYAFAVILIEKGLAYVDDSTSEEIAAQKGTPTTLGSRNKFAERTVAEKFATFYRNA